MFTAMLSNRPELAAQALEAYAWGGEWLLLCPSGNSREFAGIAKDFNVEVVVEEEFLKERPQRLSAPFAKSFGGLRNILLSYAARERKDIVFLDDDTKPANDVFERHGKLLQAAGVVLGKYSGHVGSASTALLDLAHSLEKFNDGRLPEKDFLSVLEQRLQGVPPKQRPVENAGAAGGNLGISWKTAQKYAFFPLPYRIEDGTYAALCPDPVLNPPVAESPVVVHEKSGRFNGLLEELGSDLKGNTLAAYVVACRRGVPEKVETLAKQVRKGLQIEYFSGKYAKSAFRNSTLDRIAALEVPVSQAEAGEALKLYDLAQECWRESWEAQ